MTNADKIRNLSDEELYEFRFKPCPGEYCVGKRCIEYESCCFECWMAWMKEEVKE